MIFLSGKFVFFPTKKIHDTGFFSLTYLRIISNQIAVQTTNIWHSYLLGKSVNCDLFMLFETQNLHFRYFLKKTLPFCLPKHTQLSKNVPNWKNKNKKPPAGIYFFKKVPENLILFLFWPNSKIKFTAKNWSN